MAAEAAKGNFSKLVKKYSDGPNKDSGGKTLPMTEKDNFCVPSSASHQWVDVSMEELLESRVRQGITTEIMGKGLERMGYNVKYQQADYLAQFAGLESGDVIVQVPLHLRAIPGGPSARDLHAALARHYQGRRFVTLAPLEESLAMAQLEPEALQQPLADQEAARVFRLKRRSLIKRATSAGSPRWRYTLMRKRPTLGR